MSHITEKFYWSLMRVFGKLPFLVLYSLSDICYLFFAYIYGYRKGVIDANLLLVFPEKSAKERKSIRRKYYRHLSDFFIETAICPGIKYERLIKRYKFNNPDLFKKYEEEGRHIVMLGSHYANWEWGFGLPKLVNHKLLIVYKRIDNPVFDNIFIRMRSRFGAIPVEMNKTVRMALTYAKQSKVALYLLADQSPAGAENWYFTDFLGVDGTPVFLGPEKIAKSLNAVYIYADIKKVKRRKYEVDFVTLCEDTKNTEQYELTHMYLDYLDKQVRQRPELWMWSHRRFKRRRPHNSENTKE